MAHDGGYVDANVTHGEVHSEEHAEDAHAGPDNPLVFFCFCIFIGNVLSMVLFVIPRRFRPPYSVMLFLVGLAISRASQYLGDFGGAVDSVKMTHPHIILLYLLPPLLFESANSIDFHVFTMVVSQCMWLAVAGVMIQLGLVALVFKFVFTAYNFTWAHALLVGSIVSATDPVAVVATLQTLGAKKAFSILIEGESLLNDGSAFVLFLIFKDLAGGEAFDIWKSIVQFAQLSFGGPLWGLAASFTLVMWISTIHRQPVVELGVCVLAVFATFYIAELVQVSSVLAVVGLGLYMSTRGKYYLSPETPHTAHKWWEFTAFCSNTILFVMAGVIVEAKVVSQHTGLITYIDWLFLAFLYLALHVFRAIMLMILWPIIGKTGYGLTLQQGAMMVFSGLRGAVGLSLGLIVELDQNIDAPVRSRINFHVSGIVMLTMFINGTFAEFVYKKLKISTPNPLRVRMLKQASDKLEDEARKVQTKLQGDWLYRQAQWGRVERIVPNFKADCNFESESLQVAHTESIKTIFATRSTEGHRLAFPKRPKKLDEDKRELATKLAKEFVIADFLEPLELGKYVPKFQQHDVDYHSLLDLTESDLLEMGVKKGGDVTAIMQQIHVLKSKAKQGNSRVQMYSNFFEAVRARYEVEHKREYLSKRSIVMLKASVDEGKDHLEDETQLMKVARRTEKNAHIPILCPLTNEFEKLENEVRVPSYLSMCLSVPPLRPLGMYFFYFHMRASVEALVGYIHVHEQVAAPYKHEQPHFYSVVQDKISMARESLQELELILPMFTCVIHTLFAARILLHTKKKKLEKLKSKGLLSVQDADSMHAILDARLRDTQLFVPILLDPELVFDLEDTQCACGLEECTRLADFACEDCSKVQMLCKEHCLELHQEPGFEAHHLHPVRRDTFDASTGPVMAQSIHLSPVPAAGELFLVEDQEYNGGKFFDHSALSNADNNIVLNEAEDEFFLQSDLSVYNTSEEYSATEPSTTVRY